MTEHPRYPEHSQRPHPHPQQPQGLPHQQAQSPQSLATPPQQSIPLQNLPRPPDAGQYGYDAGSRPVAVGAVGAGAASTAAQGAMATAPMTPTRATERSKPTAAQMAANLPGISTYWDTPYSSRDDGGGGGSPNSPIDPLALSFALPPDLDRRQRRPSVQTPGVMYGPPSQYYDPHHAHSDSLDSDSAPLTTNAQPISGSPAALAVGGDGGEAQPRDSFQTVPDLDAAGGVGVDGSSPSPARRRTVKMLPGFGLGSDRHRSFGHSLTPNDGRLSHGSLSQRRSRSNSTAAAGALFRTASIVRAMSQRVVNISGEGELIEQQQTRRQQRSRSPSTERRAMHHVSAPMLVDTSYQSHLYPPVPPVPPLPPLPGEKQGAGPEEVFPYAQQPHPGQGHTAHQQMPQPFGEHQQQQYGQPPHSQSPYGYQHGGYEPQHQHLQDQEAHKHFGAAPGYRRPMPNPLKGKSLGVFAPDSAVRLFLCDILVLPWTEPLILLLIVLQAVLLAVEAAPNVWDEGKQRPDRFGTKIDWAILGLFVVFTLEIIARIIVSGFVLNAEEYSTIDRARGIKVAMAERYRQIFQPQRHKSIRRSEAPLPPPPEAYGPSTFARSLTLMQGGQHVPETIEEQQRMQLARRAFLRHGFNRLDFVAVVSFWISFLLSVFGQEKALHLYVFRMLSALRILRLLAITRGNHIILRSLKKSAPLLVRVSFLIGFFWLLFAIIGVQSFKSSLSRQCVWLDPLQPKNLSAAYTNDFGFCGGYLKNTSRDEPPTTLPWVFSTKSGSLEEEDLENGASVGKGFICPRGSICLQQSNPHNGTVHFDNILYSLELVFVIMSANTWSDLMYYTTNSDYLPAALFFGAGIIIMMLWMTNLLIAVITSSFQVIREESKASAFTADQDSFIGDGGGSGADGPLKRLSTLQRVYNRVSWAFTLLIAIDLFAMAFRSARSSPARLETIRSIELVVTILLAAEIVVRFLADWRGFHRNPRNLVDLLLAVATSVILIPPIRSLGQTYEWLTVFQILRVYRVVLGIPVTSKLIRLVLGNATGIGNLMLFVFLITFLMSIFAAQLFRGEIPAQDGDGEEILVNFASIFNSFLGMYQVLTSEDWTSMLYTVTGFTTGFHTAWIAGIFFIGWFILSYFILINMFIAVIQENFDVSEDQKRLEQVKAFLQRKELGAGSSSNLAFSKLFTFGRERKRDPLDYGPAMMEMLLKEAVVKEFLDDPMDPLQRTATAGGGLQSPDAANEPSPGAGGVPRAMTTGPLIETGFLSSVWGRVVAALSTREPNPFYSNTRFDGPNENLDPRAMARQAVSATAARRKAQREYLARHPTYNNALFVFTPKNPIRRLCQRLVGPGRGSERFDGVEPNKYAWYVFSALVYASIVTMVVLACVTTPLYQREYFETHDFGVRNWFVWTDMAFAIVFTVEALIKVVADGFFFAPNAYFRSSWGVIDGVVLVTLWTNVITLFANDGAVSRAIGAFKALRALRLLNVSDSARNTFHSLIVVQGIKIVSAAAVSLSLLIPFAIYGVNLFRGLLVQCNDGADGISELRDCVGEYHATPFNNDWPLLAPRVAANPQFSFDAFDSSLFILFQIVSQERWVDVSFAAQAITQRDHQPRFGNSQGNAVFFVVFNLLATVFVLTLFISVFMRNYTEQTGVAFLTAEQRSWLELRKLLRQISPSKTSYDDSKRKWKQWCHKRAIEKRGKWYMAITGVLVLHLLLLLLQFAQEPDWWAIARDYLFLAFTLLYVANIVVRITGLGWARFRRSSWDLFSLVAVAGDLLATVLYLINKEQEAFVQLHKSFLVAVVLLLIPRNDALDQLFKTAAGSLTTIGNLLATWFVFYVMFAIAMTQSFSLTRFGVEENNNLNFRTVPKALILLFKMSAGEGWNSVMEDYAEIEPPMCVDSPVFYNSDCGSTNWARSLFILWNILSMYIFVNLFVSLIYESFSYVYQRSSGLALVDRDEIRRFKEAWRSVDPAGTGFISKEAFPRLLGELSGVFEMRVYDAEDSVRQILEDVRSEAPGTAAGRHASLVSQSAYQTGVDLHKLNARLRRIDVAKVRERRRRFNIFFEEVMVSADPDKGISFTTVLMILAHYNIISDSKSLRLEEFLRRRARLQRVEEEVRRRVVLGFFDTLYWSRQFKRHMDHKRSARMTGIPQLDVPEILVDNEEERAAAATGTNTPTSPTFSPDSPFPLHRTGSTFLSAEDARHQYQQQQQQHHQQQLLQQQQLQQQQQQHHQRTWSGASADVASFNPDQFSGHHPLGLPRSPPASENPMSPTALAGPRSGGGGGGAGTNHRHNVSAFSFELHDGAGSQPSSGPNSRRTSAVSPAQVREMLDDSVWVESIRRSTTVRRSDMWGSGSGGGTSPHRHHGGGGYL